MKTKQSEKRKKETVYADCRELNIQSNDSKTNHTMSRMILNYS